MIKLFYFLLLILFACNQQIDEPTEQEKQLTQQLIGDWVPAGNVPYNTNEKDDNPPPPPGAIPYGYTFYPNGVAEFKYGFYNVKLGKEKRDRRFYYLGNRTNYRVSNDTIFVFNLSDSVWINLPVARISPDTISIKGENSFMNYRRVNYNLKDKPTFDAIVLSTSGCFGSCPISNTMITSDGKLLFMGAKYTTKEGLMEGNITKRIYQELQDNFRKSGIDTLEKRYSTGGTDMEETSVTFIKSGKIYKTIRDYGKSGPYELLWAQIPLRHLYQHTDLKPVSTGNTPFSSYLYNFEFEVGDRALELTQSESFLLWNHLRKAKKTNAKYTPRFDLVHYGNYYWFPSMTEEMTGKGHDAGKKEKFIPVKTDGRFYTYYRDGKEPETVDIGFNFFDTNFKESELKKLED
ncbi:DUF6438 domain-containing protein [Pontibacter sp. H259]|uniref:DUF6438 domain-containing protein n=1 Tax=Pontibacter sp. H259 TaxID=3133421 RepID=UPI0030BE8087